MHCMFLVTLCYIGFLLEDATSGEFYLGLIHGLTHSKSGEPPTWGLRDQADGGWGVAEGQKNTQHNYTQQNARLRLENERFAKMVCFF